MSAYLPATPENLSMRLCQYLYSDAAPDTAGVMRYINRGADLYARTGDCKNTPLMTAVENSLTPVIAFLLERMDCVDDADYIGNTALLSTDDIEIARMLLDKGADIHKRNDRNETVVMNAARHGNAALLAFLLKVSADGIDQVTESGQTALMQAAEHGHGDCINILLDHHADHRAVSGKGQTALDSLRAHDKDKHRLTGVINRLHRAEIAYNQKLVRGILAEPVILPVTKPRLTRKNIHKPGI